MNFSKISDPDASIRYLNHSKFNQNEKINFEEAEPMNQNLKSENKSLKKDAETEKLDEYDGLSEQKVQNLSKKALNYYYKFQKAIEYCDGEELSNLIFDADCDDLSEELNLKWYE